MRKIILSLMLLVAVAASAQVTTEPAILQQGYTGQVKLIFNPNEGDKGMADATECYLYSCADVGSGWQYQLAPWPSKSTKTKMTKEGSNWVITMESLYSFYGIPADKTIKKLLTLFTDGKSDGKSGRGVGGEDIVITLAQPGLSVAFTNTLEPLVSQGTSVTLNCNATESATLTLKMNGTQVKTETGTQMSYTTTLNTTGSVTFELTGTNTGGTSTATAKTYVAATPTKQKRPTGIVNGIYYDNVDPTKATLCTYAASKTAAAKHVFVVGDFNGWQIQNGYQLKQDPDSAYFWIELSNLTPKREYAFQYAVVRPDGAVKYICDLYSEKVLTPDDKYEPKQNDPTLKAYPSQGDGFVSVLQTNKDPYVWSDATLNFQRPNKNNLVVYELWVYDYTPKRTLAGVRERLDYLQQLGINAIELMPVTEFDGNYNWGYSPCLYFALDKAYATPTQFKEFIDDCHSRGIAVIMDMVFNHATGNNPMNKLYPYGTDLVNNPWFNVTPPHKDEDGGTEYYQDWNHDFLPTKTMFKRALQYWLREYKVDGFRMDLSHGFCGENCNNRYENLKEYYNAIKAVSPDAYFIQEYWGSWPAQSTLINDGMLCWTGQGVSDSYAQLAMGYQDNSSLASASRDGYVAYNESHDEERNFYKAKAWGSGAISTDEDVRLSRVAAVQAFNVLLNGSHMLWQYGEIGYDFSINSDIDHPNGNSGDYRCNKKPRPEKAGYFSDPRRVEAYKKIAQAIQLRTRLMPSVFEGNPSSSALGSSSMVRSVQWGSNVYVVANFYASNSQTVNLPSGNWYDYFAGGTTAGSSVTLTPGEVKIYTGTKVTPPAINTDLESLLDVDIVTVDKKASSATKILRDGQVLILRGDKVYTITGMEVR